MADTTELALDLPAFLSSMRLDPEAGDLRPLVNESLTEILDDETEEERFASILAAIVYNMGEEGEKFDKQRISDLCAQIDQVVNAQLDEIYHDEHFRSFEGVWRGIDDFYNSVNFSADMDVGLLDVTKEEAFEDLEVNSADIAGSELFKKIYVAEYDQYGGQPWGSVVGLFEFENTPDDLTWLRNMGKVSTVSHAPFVGSVSPKFFGCQNMEEFNALRDIEGLMNSPRYARWNALRETEQAAYIGLTLPRYMARMPYSDETNPADGISYNEKVGIEDSSYLWAPCSLLFARNMARSFESSGWCQHLRGQKEADWLNVFRATLWITVASPCSRPRSRSRFRTTRNSHLQTRASSRSFKKRAATQPPSSVHSPLSVLISTSKIRRIMRTRSWLPI